MRNFFGAFADGAILFPLIAALALQGALPVDRLLFTAGLAYVVSGFIFQIPMPVQPLKSIAIASLAVHASGLEIRLSGGILGLMCLLLAYLVKYEKVSLAIRAIPYFFICALQTALGVLLIVQGLKVLFPLSLMQQGLSAFTLIILFCFSSVPLLGILATCGLLVGVWLNANAVHGLAAVHGLEEVSLLRVGMVLSLVLPQIALTFANSVLSTRDVAHHYFGNQAKRVTERTLLNSIGFGNVIVALIGGLPFCHGAGGLTAHYRGGARSAASNYIIGGTLLMCAFISHFKQSMSLQYPPFLLGSLLITIGWFHFGVLSTSQRKAAETLKLWIVALTTLYSQNMTAPLVVAMILSLPYEKMFRTKGVFHDFVQ